MTKDDKVNNDKIRNPDTNAKSFAMISHVSSLTFISRAHSHSSQPNTMIRERSTMEGQERDQDKEASVSFRSVLPHEPLPADSSGYIHVQGALEPKLKKDKGDEGKPSANQDQADYYWTKQGLEEALHEALTKICQGSALQSVSVLEDNSSPPYTKVRLSYSSPLAALKVVQYFRAEKVSAHDLLLVSPNNDNEEATMTSHWQFAARPLQATLLTTQPFLSTQMAWNRSNPPKFRRLIARPGEPVELLQQERQITRYVFLSGLVDTTNKNNNNPPWWDNSRQVCEAIRSQLHVYDTSGKGIELYISNKKKTSNRTTHFCHVGMRSPEDARALMAGLQGKILTWKQPCDWNDTSTCTTEQQQQQQQQQPTIQSDKLFLDYAAVTKRSEAKATAKATGEDLVKGEKSRSECTSVTKHVVVPGLVLITDFITPQEEQVLLAALTGPTAPWAPSQTNFSNSGAVKRRVQHYGYVFDYETANVNRDRSQPGSDCPPMPGMPPSDMSSLEAYTETCTAEGRGWELMAGIAERTRRTTFEIQAKDDDEEEQQGQSTITKQFPKLNQITVNVYEPGEGIGSHVDTPSAFDDGLISVSLNGGVVMEFRRQQQQQDDEKIKKLVYLPPRSLLLMSGPARFEWEHMIVTRMTDTHEGVVLHRSRRVSMTLRTAIDLSGEPMPCVSSTRFPPVWGTVGQSATDALVTPSMEREHVHAVYDAIATQWHHTRGKRGVLWPGATQFLKELPEGSIVADVGCGDGKYFPAIWEAGSYVIGSDISLPLLQQATHAHQQDAASQPDSRRVSEHRQHLQKKPAVLVADCMNVPLRSKSCDAAICIAVMHHLSTRDRRIRCISELGRIVKVGGLINIQAWAMEQQEKSKRKFAGTDVFVPFNAQPKYLEAAKNTAIATGMHPDPGKSTAQLYSEEYNADYDEQKGLVVFKRYCHMYRTGELEELVQEVDTVELYESGYESGNHFVILRVVT
ncbi:Alkylated DNA repair protein alkB homolog 8 [Seminavis robusta]|uniref:Alkylated DNA repair protein alkB homolog 8 n=1 Tax=Seminavis robusta TaxID=568900 RepID=A0A9N8HH91_9STRA|nr:Alkylated DNA repair protein alkB homolog 8 [Seminavis robusta]|eukprot:Sro691_g187920.1 Alkylated DNA repair protein alkB homolog 8 (971) ;mRNA; f:40871-43783